MNYGELEVLHHKVLTKTVVDFKFDELQGLKLFPEEPIDGITAKWDILSPSREKGAFRIPGEPATRVELSKVATRYATCILMLLEKCLDEATLAWLRSVGTDDVTSARARITQEQAELDRIIQFTKEWAAWQALSGTLSIDQDNLKLSVDYGIASEHKPTASASWATSTTDIPADLREWKRLVAQDSGLVAGRAFCNESVMEYLIKNENVSAMLGQGQLREQVAQFGYIARFMGLEWGVYDAGYKDGDNFVPFIPDDKLILVPAENVFARVQVGTQEIPTGWNETSRVFGKFSYAVVETNPPGINLFLGENFLPVVSLPGAIVYADVTP